MTLDDLLKTIAQPNPAFEAWRDSMGREPWSKFDLSAARLGWEAAMATIASAEPAAWMYEHDGMVHDAEHPPIISIQRAARVEEPWSERPLYVIEVNKA